MHHFRRAPSRPPARVTTPTPLQTLKTPTDSTAVPEQLASLSLDINIYCGGSAKRALIILACEGLLLRVLTYLVLALCPRGISFDPVVRWLSRATAALARRFRRQPKKVQNQQQ